MVVDLTDPDLYARGDPHAVWRDLRRHDPVHWHRQRHGPGFWAITRYSDIARISADPATFISAGGTSTMDLDAETKSPDDKVLGRTLVTTDPPRHNRLRALVNKAFTPRAVSRLEPYVRSAVTQILDDAFAREEIDFFADVAARLPFDIICELLGVPRDDRLALFRAISPFLEHTDDGGPRATALDLPSYFLQLVGRRADAPADDLISDLVGAELDGERLSTADTIALCVLLFVAGSETTMNAITGGMLAFVENPPQREPAVANLPRAVEEILRYVSPVMVSIIRTATRDVEVRGQLIRAGQKVTLWYPSANRDEEVFADGDRFDVARTPNEHITFGFGEHFCLGASLARLEIRVLFDEVFRRAGDVQLAGDVRRLRSNIFFAIDRMPVRVRR
jgi:cytochrome P450